MIDTDSLRKQGETMRTLHIVKHYMRGIGHIERIGANYRASFYGRRVAQVVCASLPDARKALTRLAREWGA